MATVAPSSDQAADLLQKLSLDSQTKSLEIPEPTKKPSVDSGDATNGQIQSFDRSVTPLLQDIIDPAMCYLPGYTSPAYYYGGYEGNGNEWDEYSRYVTADGVEIPPGVYGENGGSLMYHHGYGYAPYSPYSPAGSPVPTVGHDGQLYGAHQHYQYPTTTYFQQQPTPTNALYAPTSQAVPPPKGEITTATGGGTAGQVPSLSVDTNVNGNSNGISSSTGGGGAVKGNNNNNNNNTNVSAPVVVRSTYQSSSFNANNNNGSYGRGGALPAAASGYQDPRFGNNNNNYDGIRSPIPWIDGPLYSDVYHHPRNVTNSSITSSSLSNNYNNGNSVPTSRNQHLRPHSQHMGMHHPRPTTGMDTANGYMNRMYPSKLYGGNQYGNNFRSGLVYGSSNNAYDSRTNGGQGWLAVDNSKFKPRGGRGNNNGFFGYYGNENTDGLNELNRGPRAKSSSSKNQKGGFTPIALVVKGQNIPLTGTNDDKDDNKIIPDRDQYNRPDFPDNYVDAKFFIIKSYSEDDVHKSIKYNVWASTQNGNKKLDAAYQEAQQKAGACPVFLLFSVNTSGQFVGIAEMVGPVDFNKSVEYWQQDKWIGCFPVKWHIVKDVPNSLLKHITLENNENKPVTNSRDTQEVKLEQGLQLLKIFKDHSSKQCILDDFDFYEDRQKRIQEKKSKQQQFQKQVWEGKLTDERSKESSTNVDLNNIQKSTAEVVSDLVRTESTPPAVASSGNDKMISENGSSSSSSVVGSSPEKKVVAAAANCC